jgi:TRAP transporter 4TM/12TM fusion protein
MGAAVFLMAQLTHIPYIDICIAALPTAFLFFFCVFLAVHMEAKKGKLGASITNEADLLSWKTLARDSYLVLPIMIIVVILVSGFSPMRAAVFAIGGCIVVSMFNAENRLTPKRFLETLVDGGKSMVMIGNSCAAAGLIVSIIINTGLGLTFSSIVITFAQGRLIVALLLVMVTTVILSMGLPATPSYVLAISIGGPILVELGGGLLAAHMFVFYFAILAPITPPIPMAAFAAASIAGGNPMLTAFQAVRLAIAGYIVPYLFFFNDGVLLFGGAGYIILCIAVAIIGVVFMVIALGGWMLTHVKWVERAILLILAVVIAFPIVPNVQSLILGVITLGILYITQRYRRCR